MRPEIIGQTKLSSQNIYKCIIFFTDKVVLSISLNVFLYFAAGCKAHLQFDYSPSLLQHPKRSGCKKHCSLWEPFCKEIFKQIILHVIVIVHYLQDRDTIFYVNVKGRYCKEESFRLLLLLSLSQITCPCFYRTRVYLGSDLCV